MSSSSDNSIDYEDFDSLEIPFEEVASATNNFSDQNLIAQGTSVHVYKGLLSQSGELINIVARKSQQMDKLTKELVMSENLKHTNIVSPFKISADPNGEVIIINIHAANGSLDKHLHGSTPSWMQRLRICVGVARALSYIHNHYIGEQSHSVIHGNIKSSKILLDQNWESKLQGFGYSMIVKKHHLYLTSKYNGTLGYMDPAYEETGGLTHKSDVFSFGVVLFEVLFGRKAFHPINEDNWFFTRLARLHYEKRTLKDMIDPDLWKQMDLGSFKIFSETAYCCLKEKREERPNMEQVVEALEKALEFQQKYESPELLIVNGASSKQLKGENFEHLKIPLSDILLATQNFSQSCVIGSGGYGMVYKAELEHFDSKNYSVKGDNKCNLPKKRSPVAIKRIFKREDTLGEQGFITEIETLTTCKHENIVSLLGFCDEGPQMILVYEHVSNGSLDDYLGTSYKMTNLTWGHRIQICLDIAHGLMYIHSGSDEKQKIIHRDIKSANILLDDNWKAKIADFGLSKSHPKNQETSTLNTNTIAGTEVYLDPEYMKTGALKKESDIYSFGVVLFEIFCGKLAYDEIYNIDNEKGLPYVARRHFKEGRLMDIFDPKIKGVDKNIFMSSRGANQNSIDTFAKIAYQCLAETQDKRPTMELVIKELEKALYFQDSNKDNLQISLEDIKLATQNFNDRNCIIEGTYWKQYEGRILNANMRTTVIIKRWDRKSEKGKYQFFTELKVLYEQKHENIVALVGYCNEMDEKIIVYEYASNGRLSYHLDNASLTWMERLKICIDVSTGLDFLHRGDVQKEAVIHRDIKSSSILLDSDRKAKFYNLELSTRSWEQKEIEHVTDDNANGSLGYIDPMYEQGFLTKKSDIYSLGVVLFEILCGRLAWGDGCVDRFHSLGPMAIRYYEEEKLDELVFGDIKEQIDSESLAMFADIAVQCLDNDDYERPPASEVVVKLKKALELQEDYEIWEPKLPSDYSEILSMSKFHESGKIYTKKGIYDILCKGIPLRDSYVNLSIGSYGEKNYMISARKFSYENRWALNWRHIPQSRFHKVAEMLSISNLKIRIKIRTQFLSPGVNYGVHLVFKLCSPRKASSTPMYVNLIYKMRNEILHAYFATWRDQDWMMIELYRFLNHKDDNNFEVILESFSRYYCGNGAIYIEGIEFRVINHVIKHETEKVQQLPTYLYDIFQRCLGEHMYLLKMVKGKMHYMFSAKEVCHNAYNVKSFHLKPSTESRFEEVIDLQPQQVFDIKCNIESYMLSIYTDYACYLVFKLTKNSHGLHCPVKVTNLSRWSKKETKIIYFRSPSPWTLHDMDRVPKEREDGWMEVIVWRFNSDTGRIPVNLKFITYEGTMSGLTVYGLEFRPMTELAYRVYTTS